MMILRPRESARGGSAEETVTRNEFEAAARKQNEKRAAQVVEARVNGGACKLVAMMAFGPGVHFCTTHQTVVGALGGGASCPFDRSGS